MFSVTSLLAYRNRHPKTFLRCQSCKVDLPHPSTINAPLDIVLTHNERYPYHEQKTNKVVWTAKESEVPLHARYDCIVQRYPFFSVHLIKIPAVTRHFLAEVHKQWLYEQFGYPLQ
jgi:hypothetical protein